MIVLVPKPRLSEADVRHGWLPMPLTARARSQQSRKSPMQQATRRCCHDSAGNKA